MACRLSPEWNRQCNALAQVAVPVPYGVPVSRAVGYAVAVLATILVAITRGALDPWLQDQAVLLPFTLAVVAAAVVGGLAPGLLAAALSMLISVVAFFEPRGTLAVQSVSDVLHLTVFAGVSVIVCLLSHRLEQALAHAIRFERHLERSNQRLDVAQECVDAGVWEWDIEHDRGYWSPGYRLLIGVPEDAPVSMAAFFERLHPSDRVRVQQDVQHALDEGEFRSEYRVLDAERGEVWLLSAGRTQRNESGRPVRLTGIAVDISERKRSEQALRESREQFRTIADTMPHFVWSARPDGYIDYYNERWYEYTGMPRTPDQGWNWKLYVHSDDLGRTVEAWEQSLATGAPLDVQYRMRRGADGTYRWFMGRALPIRGDRGEITRWFGTCTDVDEHRRLGEARDALLAAERAARAQVEHAMRQRDEFVATLAHELRTPLNAILGWTQMLRRPASADVVARGLEVIERNTRAQAQVISDLLDIGHITAGKIRLARETVDLLGIVRAAVSIVRPAAEAKGVRIDATTDAAAIVSGDPARLQQVAWNLLSNAVKSTPAGGTIDLVAQRVDDVVELRVTDSGEGIAPEFLPFLFDRYRQADASATRSHGGLGLGLSLAKHIVELHGGTIEACSEGPGRGATFLVRLPTAQPTDRTGGPAYPDISLAGAHVLVVEDQPDGRELVARIILEGGGRVSRAENAAEAIASFTHEAPDLVISDIAMPGMDGYELLTRLRALEEGRRIPAIALTPFARAEDRTRSLLAGYQGHVPKPVDPSELLATVASLLQLSERSNDTPKGVSP
jgi:PAS domain S-box-containing protein